MVIQMGSRGEGLLAVLATVGIVQESGCFLCASPDCSWMIQFCHKGNNGAYLLPSPDWSQYTHTAACHHLQKQDHHRWGYKQTLLLVPLVTSGRMVVETSVGSKHQITQLASAGMLGWFTSTLSVCAYLQS